MMLPRQQTEWMKKQQHLSSNQLKMDQQEEEAGMAALMNIMDVSN